MTLTPHYSWATGLHGARKYPSRQLNSQGLFLFNFAPKNGGKSTDREALYLFIPQHCLAHSLLRTHYNLGDLTNMSGGEKCHIKRQ